MRGDSDGSPMDGRRHRISADFPGGLNICLMPFDFAGDDAFDEAMDMHLLP